jgi:hypothetical protein
MPLLNVFLKKFTKTISLNLFYCCLAEMFEWSKTWKDGKTFCSTLGSSWRFQFPQTWVNQINHFESLQMHFVNWQKGLTDKGNHVFWFIGAGPGCGKSRCLDEFPEILRLAAAELQNCDELQQRLQDMCVIKISFENGTGPSDLIPVPNLIPAYMAFQLQKQSSTCMSWSRFSASRTAIDMTFDAVFEKLVLIRQAANDKDITILILIDGLQQLESTRPILIQICNLVNMSQPFVMIACSATVQTSVRNFLKLSGQPCITLTPPAILEPAEFESVYQAIGQYEDGLIVKMMVRDMNGHGRALEYLLDILSKSNLNAFKPNSIMNDVKSRLKVVYHGWNPCSTPTETIALFSSIMCGRKLYLSSPIPGTSLDVDQVLQCGLFRYDADTCRLTGAYVWMLLLCDNVPFKELQDLIDSDYDKLRDKITHGKSSALSFDAFEEFWCNFRVVRSRCFNDGELVLWNNFHAGAIFTGSCAFSFVNKHLTFVRAAKQFSTKSSSKDNVCLINGAKYDLRKCLTDKVVLNCQGAPSGDSMVVLELPDDSICTEGHQCKRLDVSTLTAGAVEQERLKAVEQSDCFIVICSGKLEKELFTGHLQRTAIINIDCFEEYFGSFAGRAFAYRFCGPVNVNMASVVQLIQCEGIAEATALKIIEKRPFSGPDDFKKRVRHFSDDSMKQFLFS